MVTNVIVRKYDYFDYSGRLSKPEVYHFNSLGEAFAFYKQSKSKDFDYGDSHRITELQRTMDNEETVIANAKHGLCIGHRVDNRRDYLVACLNANSGSDERIEAILGELEVINEALLLCSAEDEEYFEDEDLFGYNEEEDCFFF